MIFILQNLIQKMFNDRAYPYVKSMNSYLRKTHLEEFQDFKDKSIELKATSSFFEKDGLFCLVDFIETNEVYIFKIREFTQDNITLDSFLKITKEQWLSLDCKEHITKPGLMRSNTLKFISGIKNIVFPNHKEFENNKLQVKMLKSKLKIKSKKNEALQNKNKLLEKKFKVELDLNKEYYENRIKFMEEEFEIKLSSEKNEKEVNMKKEYEKTIVDANNKLDIIQERFEEYKKQTETKIGAMKQDFENKILAEKQKIISDEKLNITNNLNEFVSIMFFIVPIILHNIFSKNK